MLLEEWTGLESKGMKRGAFKLLRPSLLIGPLPLSPANPGGTAQRRQHRASELLHVCSRYVEMNPYGWKAERCLPIRNFLG